ncbi:MAG: hypothetical protein KDA51_08770, partial [Planctomycetales bacterium]|nr:hypothetical protein [Planctomycetales bacterium]
MKEQYTALTRSTQAVTPETRTQEFLSESSAGTQRRILWIDGVGGFLLVESDEVLIGQAIPGTPVDVAVVGDLSRRAAVLRRTGGDYLLQPFQQTCVDHQAIDRPQLLRNTAEIQLGSRVKLQFTKPSPLSATARLDMTSLNRFKPNVDGILLLSDSCIIGPNAGSHVLCPDWRSELLLFRQGSEWYFRSLVEVQVDGKPMQGQIPVTAGMR